MMDFSGKTVVVASANQGPGRALALEMGRRQARVVVSGPDAEETALAIRAQGGNAASCPEPHQEDASWREACQLFGEPDWMFGPQGARRRGTGPASPPGGGPLIATVAVTARCPLSCAHCSLGGLRCPDPPADTVIRWIRELAELGCPVIALTGGEPLVRREIADFAAQVPAGSTPMIFTSGWGLSRELAKRLCGAHPRLTLAFSLDHGDPAAHDAHRGRAGAFRKAVDGLALLAGKGPFLHVSTLATRQRVLSGELMPFIRDAGAWGAEYVQVFQPRPVGRVGYGDERLLLPEHERQVLGIAREICSDEKAPKLIAYPVVEHADALGCCGGYARLFIDPRGEVRPCDFSPLSFGNARREPLSGIWRRMREHFPHPGSACLVRDRPDIFTLPGKAGTIAFEGLSDRALRSTPPQAWTSLGEDVYRLFLSDLPLSTLVAALGSGRIRRA